MNYFDYLGRERKSMPMSQFMSQVWSAMKKAGKSNAEGSKVLSMMHYGCIGITAGMLGKPADLKNCYESREEADIKRKQMKDDKECCPKIYSVHLHNNTGSDRMTPDAVCHDDDFVGPLPEGVERGQVDLSNWDQEPKPGGGGNFDYGFFDDAKGVYISGDKYHNPDKDNDGVGDFFKDSVDRNGKPYEIREGNVFFSTPDDWELEDTNNFYNLEVFCVQCGQDDY